MNNRFLTKHGHNWVFQRRLPKTLDPGFDLAPLRITLGPMPLRQARRIALLLAAAAQLAFDQIIREADVSHDRSKIRPIGPMAMPKMGVLAKIKELMFVDAEGQFWPLPGGPLHPDTRLEDLVTSGPDPRTGDLVTRLSKVALLEHYVMVPTLDEQHRVKEAFRAQEDTEFLTEKIMSAVAFSAAARTPSADSEDIAQLKKSIEKLTVQLKPKETPTFQEAATNYIDSLRATNGDNADTEIQYIEHRKIVFIALIGNKPVGEYTRKDLQDFVDEIQYLPPNYARADDYDVTHIKKIIADARNLERLQEAKKAPNEAANEEEWKSDRLA